MWVLDKSLNGQKAFHQRQVRRMILAESLRPSAAGTSFGILAGVWLDHFQVAAMNDIRGQLRL